MNPKRVYAYIDGLNLYYGSVNNTLYKWLDVFKLSQFLIPHHNLVKLKYFTAIVKPMGDRNRPARQKKYLDAIKHINGDKVEIIKGQFRLDPRPYVIAKKQYKTPYNDVVKNLSKVWIMKPEEKGSDVNLAVSLVLDAFKDNFDIALVISNDSDLAMAFEVTKKVFGKKILVCSPRIKNSSLNRDKIPVTKSLLSAGGKQVHYDIKQLKNFQMDEKINGIAKPDTW